MKIDDKNLFKKILQNYEFSGLIFLTTKIKKRLKNEKKNFKESSSIFFCKIGQKGQKIRNILIMENGTFWIFTAPSPPKSVKIE